MKLFFDDQDYRKLLWVFADGCERHALDCLQYCGMPNHYHLVVHTREPNLSRAMHYINGTFAQWWNARHAHVGHVFQGRFKAQIVESGQSLCNVSRYIIRNPLRAGLVQSLEEWPWSSYHALAGRDVSPPFLNEDLALRVVGPGTARERRERFRALVDADDSEADADMQLLVRSDTRVIGSDTFKARFDAVARSASTEVPRRERYLARPGLERFLQDNVGRLPLGQVLHQAQLAGHSINAIAECLGLSERSVRRQVMLGARVNAAGAASSSTGVPSASRG